LMVVATIILTIPVQTVYVVPDSPDTPTDGVHSPTETETATETPTSDVQPYDVKKAVQQEYDPGTCFGMPGMVTEDHVNETIADNDELVESLCNDYPVTKNDSHKLYTMIQQFGQIQVTEQSNGTYNFTVRDGECCVITTIRGVYNPVTGDVTETTRTNETVPC